MVYRNRLSRIWALSFVCLVLGNAGFAAQNEFLIRNIYDQAAISKTPDQVIEHIKIASACGYNSLISCDLRLEELENRPQKILNNYQKAFAAAKENGIKLIPWHFYQQQPAHENYNLAEAFPVKGTKFLVADSKAQGMGDHDIGLENGGFENFTGSKPNHWGVSNPLVGYCHMDKTEKKTGTASLYVKAAPRFSRITQTIKLKPFRAYEISAWFKTANVNYYTHVQFGMESHMLYRRQRPFGSPKVWSRLTPNMNWRKCAIDFNSLNNTVGKLSLWFAYRHPQSGQDAKGKSWEGEIWVDDIQIREVGLYETLRGKSKPIIVRSKDGVTTYQEGRDYTVDPKCDSFTAEDYWYEGHLAIPQGSAIQNGQELRVDWFQYANIETIIPESDFCLPESWSTLSENVSHIDKLFGHQDAMFCNLDEWRVAGWNEHCEMFKFQTAGEYMAKTMRSIETMLHGPVNGSGNGCRKIITVSDMFDPYHNSNPTYVACKGGTSKSWEGLGDNVIIFNWNMYSNCRYTKSSLRFFAGQDSLAPNLRCKQLVMTQGPSYANLWCDILDDLEKEGFDGVTGMAWVTWRGDYSSIDATAAAHKARGRWADNPFPEETCPPESGLVIPEPSVIASQAKTALHSTRFTAIPTGTHTKMISFSLPEYSDIEISVYCPQGKKVRTLLNAVKPAGKHTIDWDTKKLSAGIYFIRMSGEGLVRKTLRQIIL